MKLRYFFPLLLLGAGCTAADTIKPMIDVITESAPVVQATAVLPVEEYVERRTFKAFGEYISDRFTGYHVGDDIEFIDVDEEVPVYAIMDGTVVRIADVSGYGGMALIAHGDVNAIYGHIDLSSSSLSAGDAVTMGQFIANLGNGYSDETDGERKHLHFGLYEGEPTRTNGYEATASGVLDWLNPQDWFGAQGVAMDAPARTFGAGDLGSDVFHLSFVVPDLMEVEYVPSLQALNVFTLDGGGTARERSQLFIRYFDASTFLTLSTVNVYSTQEVTVGAETYEARRYDIAKKNGVANFTDQPLWRNVRHLVTDFTDGEGYGRYYVVAANPDLDPAVYEAALASMRITQ